MAQRYVVIIFQLKDFIRRTIVPDLQSKLDSVITTNKKNTEIDLWIDSPGGSAHAAYKIWLELRERADKLRAWIPDYAKSAATLLTLGVDEIYMDVAAELGPLDVQIEHPDRENITVSALDVVESLDYLSKFTIELAIAGGASLIKFTELSRTDILKQILPFAAKLIEPCVNKIDPHLTHKAAYQLRVAEHYAQRMLEKRNLPNNKKLSTKDSQELVKKLVREYPVHECIIDRQELKLLGLPVYEAEKDKNWPKVKLVYNQYMSSKQSMLEVFPFDMIMQEEAPDEAKKNNKKENKKKTKKS